MKQQINAIKKTLAELEKGTNPLVCQLASSLARSITAAENLHPDSISDPNFREIGEIISALTEKTLSRGESPSLILEALIEIDSALMAKTPIQQPIAGRFVPLAGERALQATAVHHTEHTSTLLSEQSPIFPVDRGTLCATPVGPLTDEGLARFVDRVIAEAAKKKPKKILLVKKGIAPSPKVTPYFSLLEDELTAMKIRLEYLG